jgi:AraC-like DNA-binding protein
MWRSHQRAFDAPVHFGQRTNAIVFKPDDLHRRMPGADIRRLVALREELVRIAGDAGSISLVDRMKSEIRSNLPDGGGTVESISDALGIPRWTLQRRLAAEGCSFTNLVDLVRRDLAEQYLRQFSLPATETAFLLGYSELSAFSRAFRRWWNLSPQKFRQQLMTR